MRCGLAVFCRTLRVRGRTLLLYAVGVALSVATILIVTARDTLEDKKTGFHLGADDYLTKPVDFEEMLLRIEALLR